MKRCDMITIRDAGIAPRRLRKLNDNLSEQRQCEAMRCDLSVRCNAVQLQCAKAKDANNERAAADSRVQYCHAGRSAAHSSVVAAAACEPNGPDCSSWLIMGLSWSTSGNGRWRLNEITCTACKYIGTDTTILYPTSNIQL